jgi:excisionase family DNA binding protein
VLLTVAEVVERLHRKVGRSTVYDWISRGTLRASKIGGRVLIHEDSLDQLLAPPSAEPAEPPALPSPAKKTPTPRSHRRALEPW